MCTPNTQRCLDFLLRAGDLVTINVIVAVHNRLLWSIDPAQCTVDLLVLAVLRMVWRSSWSWRISLGWTAVKLIVRALELWPDEGSAHVVLAASAATFAWILSRLAISALITRLCVPRSLETEMLLQGTVEAGGAAGGSDQQPTARTSGTSREDLVHWTRLLGLARTQKTLLTTGSVVLLIRLPFSISLPHFVSESIGGLMDGDVGRVKHAIILLIVCGTIDALLDFWCVFLFSLVQQRIVRDLKRDLFASLLSQPLTFFDNNSSGELMSRITSDTGQMANDLSWVFRFSIEAVVRICGVAGYMFYMSWRLALLTTCIVPVNSVLNVYYGKWMQKNALEVQDTLASANSNANEVLGSVRTVKAFYSEENEYDRFAENLENYYKLQVKQAIVRSGYYMVISTFLMNMVVQAAVLSYGGWLCVEGVMAVERLVGFMLYRSQFQEWFNMLLSSYSDLVRGAGASTRVFNLLDRRQPFCHLSDSTDGVANSRAMELAGRRWRGEVKLKNVSFVYPSRPSSFVLRNLSLTAPGGECTCLVGESGAGKSTIFYLLQRLYQCPSGRIFIDGVDVNTIPTRLLRRKLLGLVGQEPVLFRGSIRTNVLYGVDNGGREDGDNGDHRLQAALKIGHCMGFVGQLPGGVDCEVGERAVQLSGGQKQRLAIARAVAMDPRILLLDEATSALDSESERQVQEALDEAMVGRTTLSITHRVLSAARLASTVVVLDKGRVIETGRPNELLKDKKSAFKLLLDRQQCLPAS
ncbi:hypothetical protein FOL46_001581 [Perkinsus olseni]|uniref:ATP-binding cassette sub- B member 7, mitochondrial n=1 Tax=Perkinsus olseni TaxID=32597 RepID=A0A7J6MCB0_PEROL|nr:hypothetical protein FOL46_001581 [Perkinsus olseni]